MKRDQVYRGYCAACKTYVAWMEPSGRPVDRILCPGCGNLLDCLRSSSYPLKGEVQAVARTFTEGVKRGR
jgi:hypothetical protein